MANREETIRMIRSSLNRINKECVTTFEMILEEAINAEFETPISLYEVDCSKQIAKLARIITEEKYEDLIPGLGNVRGVNEQTANNEPERFLLNWASAWVRKYRNACLALPSKRHGSESETTNDPAITAIITGAFGDAIDVVEMRNVHRVFESAEIIGGNLLEEYIAKSAQKRGWIWCNGSVLRGVDFCNEQLNYFIQVKNRDNTHNSSSRSFIEGLGNTVNWYRMTSRRGAEQTYNWDELRDLFREGAGITIPRKELNEKDYRKFLNSVTRSNPEILYNYMSVDMNSAGDQMLFSDFFEAF